MTDLVPITELLDVQTGEILPATVGNAGRVITAARDMRTRINDVVAAATAYLADESKMQGTKTLHGDGQTITLSGGVSDEYDVTDLRSALELAHCPEDRIDAAIVAHIEYKVNRSVLRQLAAANDEYKAAIESATRQVEKPYRASLKGPT